MRPLLAFAFLLPQVAYADCVYTGARRAYIECIYGEVVDTASELATWIAEVSGLRAEVDDLDGRVGASEADIEALYTTVSLQSEELDGHDQEIGTVVSKIDVVLNKLDVVERGKLSRSVTTCTVTNVVPQGTNTCHFKWAAAHCSAGVPVGTCEGFISWAQQSGDDEDWRVMLPGEVADGQTFTDGGMLWWNDNGCGNSALAIRATYLCEVVEE